MGKDNFQNFWSMKGKNAEFPTSTLSFPHPLLCMPSYPQTLTHRTPPQWKLMAKLGALNIMNWGKFLTSLLQVCARYLYLENYTDKKKLKIKPQPFCTQKSKVIFSSLLTPLIYNRRFPWLKIVMPAKIHFLRKHTQDDHTGTNSGYLETRAGVGSVALQMPQHGRWRLSRGPLPGGTSAHGLFLLSKSREILGKYFFLLSVSSVSVQPLPHSHLDCSRNWYTRYSDFWAVFASCFEARCLFNIRSVCPTVCEPLPLSRDLGVGYLLSQNAIQARQELLKFRFRFKFHLQLQKNKHKFDI